MTNQTKTEIEDKIKKIGDYFFSLDKNNEETSEEYKTYRNKLLTEIWNYYKNFQYNKKCNDGESLSEKYSGVINETAINCIKKYKPDVKSELLHYLNKSISNAIHKEIHKDNLCGIKIPRSDYYLWKEIKKLAYYKKITLNDYKKLYTLGEQLGKSKNEIKKALDYGKLHIIDNENINKNGETISIFESIKSNSYDNSKVIENIIKRDEIDKFFQIVEEIFLNKQDRIKPYLSALLTLEYIKELIEYGITIKKNPEYAFIDEELYNEFKNKIKTCQKGLNQQEIAKRFGRDKTDASRTLKKIKGEINKKKCQLSINL